MSPVPHGSGSADTFGNASTATCELENCNKQLEMRIKQLKMRNEHLEGQQKGFVTKLEVLEQDLVDTIRHIKDDEHIEGRKQFYKSTIKVMIEEIGIDMNANAAKGKRPHAISKVLVHSTPNEFLNETDKEYNELNQNTNEAQYINPKQTCIEINDDEYIQTSQTCIDINDDQYIKPSETGASDVHPTSESCASDHHLSARNARILQPTYHGGGVNDGGIELDDMYLQPVVINLDAEEDGMYLQPLTLKDNVFNTDKSNTETLYDRVAGDSERADDMYDEVAGTGGGDDDLYDQVTEDVGANEVMYDRVVGADVGADDMYDEVAVVNGGDDNMDDKVEVDKGQDYTMDDRVSDTRVYEHPIYDKVAETEM
jgi:hypothetical protein